MEATGEGFRAVAERPRALLIGESHTIEPILSLAEQLLGRTDEAFRVLALFGSDAAFPFRARPSTILVPGMPVGVIAALPLLEERGIASRLASTLGLPGCHEGAVTDLARHWLAALDRSTLDEVEIFACGTTAMLQEVAALAREFRVASQSMPPRTR